MNRTARRIVLASILILLTFLVLLWRTKSATKPLANKSSSRAVDTNRSQGVLSNEVFSVSNNRVTTAIMAAKVPVVANATNTPSVKPDGQISASALKQIAALEKEKESRTPTEQKIDSQLLYADKMRRGEPIAKGVPVQRVDLDKDDQGRILVDIKADVTDALLQYIKTLGGNVVNDFPQYQAIRAGVPLANIEDLAARGEVKFVEPAVRAMNNVDSEGDYTHQAINARTTFSVNGTGVKIGVLSGDVAYLNSSQIAGESNSSTGTKRRDDRRRRNGHA